jgi:hypothetical protein
MGQRLSDNCGYYSLKKQIALFHAHTIANEIHAR